MELHALAQRKAPGIGIDPLPRLGEPRPDRHIGTEIDQGVIESEVDLLLRRGPGPSGVERARGYLHGDGHFRGLSVSRSKPGQSRQQPGGTRPGRGQQSAPGRTKPELEDITPIQFALCLRGLLPADRRIDTSLVHHPHRASLSIVSLDAKIRRSSGWRPPHHLHHTRFQRA